MTTSCSWFARVLFGATLSVVSAEGSVAQGPDIAPGTRVKIVWHAKRPDLYATYVRGTADTLWLQYPQWKDSTVAATVHIRELSVYRGQGQAVGRGFFRGLLHGAAVGAILGLAPAIISSQEECSMFCGLGIVIGYGGLFGAIGAVLGAIGGISYEVWEPVALPSAATRM